MDQLSPSDRDQGIAAAVLAAITSETPSDFPSKPYALAFQGRPDPVAITKIATERMNQMDPAPPLAERKVVRLVWVSWLVARTAKTSVGRTAALNEAVDALATLHDESLRQRLLIEQWAGSSPNLRLEYELLVSAHPVLGTMVWKSESADEEVEAEQIIHKQSDRYANEAVKSDQCIATVVHTQNVVHSSTEKSNHRKPCWSCSNAVAKPIVAVSLAASFIVCFAMWKETKSHSDNSAQTDPVKPAMPKDETLPFAAQVTSTIPTTTANHNTGRSIQPAEPVAITYSDLDWLRSENVPLPPPRLSDPVAIKFISSYSQSRNKSDAIEASILRELKQSELTNGLCAPNTTDCLNALAQFYMEHKRYADAQPHLKLLLTIRETELEPNQCEVATCLENLAESYFKQNEYALAKPLFRRALVIRTENLGVSHPYLSLHIENLAKTHLWLQEFSEAERLFQRALDLHTAALASNHPDIATCLENLAMSHLGQSHLEKAGQLFQRALDIRTARFGPDAPLTAASLNSLAILNCAAGNYPEAEQLLRKVVSIAEANYGNKDGFTANCIHNLAKVHLIMGSYTEAESLFRRVYEIRLATLGADDEDTKEAEELMLRAVMKSGKSERQR